MEVTKRVFRFMLKQMDFMILLFILLLKVYIFAKVSGTIFVTLMPIDYLKEFFAWVFGAETELRIFEGVIMVSVGTILLSTFWILFLHGRKRFVAIFIINALLSFIILADVIYYRYFEDIISITVLMQMKQLGDVGESVFALFSWTDLIFFIDLLLMIPLLIYYFRKTRNHQPAKPLLIPKLLTGLLVLVIGYQLTFIPFNKSMENGGAWQFNKLISNMRVYNFTGLLGFHGANLQRYTEDNFINKKEYTEEEVESVASWFEERNVAPAASPYSGMAKDKNIIVLQVEALQDFVINREINGQEITPYLNSLIAEEGIYFPEFYEQTGVGRTSDAEFLLNTSLYPTAKGSAYMLYAENEYDSFPQILKDKGYSTNVFHPYKPSFWNRYIMYKQLGIDQFFSESDFEEDEVIGWAINDDALLQQSLDKMVDMEEPFYSHIITLTSHHPFEMPDDHKVLNMDGYAEYSKRHFRNYLHSIHFVDQAIGNFVDRLKAEGLWDDTMLVIFGDHSTGLTADDPAFSEFADAGEPQSYFEANKKVPLIFHIPGVDEAQQFDQTGSQLDLAPTLLDLIDAPSAGRKWIGSNLWDGKDRQVTFRDGSLITGDLTYIPSSDGIYDNGSCYERESGETLPTEQCRAPFDKGMQELQMSDDVLEGNLINRFEK